MRVQEHISAHQRAKFCREFRRYREQILRAERAMRELQRVLRDSRKEGCGHEH